jgi:hypothetical protein
MDASELIDFRSNSTPLALWQNMVVLGVHHDGIGDMPADSKIAAEPLVYETLCVLTAALSPVITRDADSWLVQNWSGTSPA